jgi:trans-aconitate methyltransferase
LPIPPRKLIVLVAGNANITYFLHGGQLAAQSIRETLQRNNVPMESFHTMLDFGCGCGRVIRNWRSLDRTDIYGSDYNHELIAECGRNLHFAHFESNDLAPPLRHESDKFDLIFALSVFTHLPGEL